MLLRESTPRWLEAIGVWAMCGSHAGSYETDGLVSMGFVRSIVGDEDADLFASELCKCGLWSTAGMEIRFHDFHEYNPSKQDLDAERKRAADRQARYIKGKSPTSRNTNAVSDGVSDASLTRHSRSYNAGPDPVDKNNILSDRARVREAEEKKQNASRKAEHEKESSIDSIASAFSEARKAACGVPYKRQLSDYNGLIEAVDIFQECAKNMGTDAATLARRSADNFCAQKWAQEHDYPIRAWLKDPARNLSNNKAVDPTAGMTPREKWEYENLRG